MEYARNAGQVLGVRQACYYAVISELVEQISTTSTEVGVEQPETPVRGANFVYQR